MLEVVKTVGIELEDVVEVVTTLEVEDGSLEQTQPSKLFLMFLP